MGPTLNLFAAIVFFTFVRSWLPRQRAVPMVSAASPSTAPRRRPRFGSARWQRKSAALGR